MERAFSNESDTEFFNFLDNCSPKVKISIIQNEIIPLMNLRRGTSENLSSEAVSHKLDQLSRDGKAGEKAELRYELLSNGDIQQITPKLAHELADITYYGLQPNADKKHQYKYLLESELLNIFFYKYNATNDFLNLCIIKYSTRLQYGNEPDYKEIEFKKLEYYLNMHPNFRDIWIVKGS